MAPVITHQVSGHINDFPWHFSFCLVIEEFTKNQRQYGKNHDNYHNKNWNSWSDEDHNENWSPYAWSQLKFCWSLFSGLVTCIGDMWVMLLMSYLWSHQKPLTLWISLHACLEVPARNHRSVVLPSSSRPPKHLIWPTSCYWSPITTIMPHLASLTTIAQCCGLCTGITVYL